VTITCDRCGSTITGAMSTMVVAGELADTVERIDLCQPCSTRLMEWLRSPEPKVIRLNSGPLQEPPK
jgi:hypothetical protein